MSKLTEAQMIEQFLSTNKPTECPPAKAEGINYSSLQNDDITQQRRDWKERTGRKLS